jgi:predicted aspartyl protease
MTMKRIAAAAAMLAALPAASVQPLPPPGPASEIATGADRYERMTVPVTINGEGPFPFVIDTGAERTMVSTELALSLGLKSPGDAIVHAVTGRHRVPLYSIDRLSVAGDGVDFLEAPSVSRSRLGAVGLLGLDSLQNSHVVFDIGRDTMTVRASSAADRPARSYGNTIVITAEKRHGRLIFTKARINGVAVRVVVDTGAQVSLGNEALRQAILRRRVLEERVGIISVVGDTIEGDILNVQKLTLDGLSMIGGKVIFSDAPIFAQLDLEAAPALLLGMSTFRAFQRVEIDFPKRQVSFVLGGQPAFDGLVRSGCRGTRIDRGGC